MFLPTKGRKHDHYIFVIDRQTSIVTFLTSENRKKKYQDDGFPVTKEEVKPRNSQMASIKKRKKKKLLPEPSSGKMIELMRRFVTKKQENRNNSMVSEGPGTGSSNSKEQDERIPTEEVGKVLQKMVTSFSSIDIRLKKTFETPCSGWCKR